MIPSLKRFLFLAFGATLALAALFRLIYPYVGAKRLIEIPAADGLEFLILILGIALGLVLFNHARLTVGLPLPRPAPLPAKCARPLYVAGQVVANAGFWPLLYLAFSDSSLMYSGPTGRSIDFSVCWALMYTGLILIFAAQVFGQYGTPPVADTIMATDQRPPVIYLRSFDEEEGRGAFVTGLVTKYKRAFSSRDGMYLIGRIPRLGKQLPAVGGSRGLRRNALGSHRSMFDEQILFASVLELVGPYIAIGRPSENFLNMDLGAAKKYVQDHEWKPTVLRLLRECAAVVIEVGTSRGIMWEIETAIKTIDPKKILLILPWKDEEYKDFLYNTQNIFPIPLPRDRPPSRLLMFYTGWEPVELINETACLESTLGPFLDQVSIIQERQQEITYSEKPLQP